MKLKKKGFTIIELIVVMAVIAVLVLLAMPKFMGYTKKAELTKYISTSKEIEKAAERYYLDHQEWPRLSDTHYSAEQIDNFSEKIFDATGKTIALDANGQYYDIDYNKLGPYINVPVDKEHYILQNPVGSVYVLEGLTETAKNRLETTTPSKPLLPEGTMLSSSVVPEKGTLNDLIDGDMVSAYTFKEGTQYMDFTFPTEITIDKLYLYVQTPNKKVDINITGYNNGTVVYSSTNPSVGYMYESSKYQEFMDYKEVNRYDLSKFEEYKADLKVESKKIDKLRISITSFGTAWKGIHEIRMDYK